MMKYIILLAIPCIFLFFLVRHLIKKNEINEEIQKLKATVENIVSWDLNEYVNNLTNKEIPRRVEGKYLKHISFERSYFYDGTYGLFFYEDIISVDVTSSYSTVFYDTGSISIVILSKTKFGDNKKTSFGFEYKYLSYAKEFYKIILNIIAIVKKRNESKINSVITSIEENKKFENIFNQIKSGQINIEKFINEYEKDVFHLIENSESKSFAFFNNSMYEALFKDKLSQEFVANDGFYTDGYVSKDKDIENACLFIKGLRKRIKNYWSDNATVDTIAYFIIRNSVIKYYNKFYELNCRSENIEDFCSLLLKIPKENYGVFKMAYVCNYITKTDIFLPVYTTYHNISDKIKDKMFVLEQEKKENALFTNSIDENNNEDIKNSQKHLSTIEIIDQMTGEEFEHFLVKLFNKAGYNAVATPLSGDFGVDIIVENELVKIGVQAKRYSDRVTNSAIQEIVAGIKHYNLDKGMVVTNNYFTRAAKELAKDNNIVLWDRDILIEKISKG